MTWGDRYQKEMLHRLHRHLNRLEISDIENLLCELEPEIERSIAANSHMMVDNLTRPHLRLAAVVLASHHALASDLLEPQQAFELIEWESVGVSNRGN